MTTVELATCRVPEDSASPASVCVWVGGGGGYVVVCMVFYEWGFGMASHRFLRSLLRSYDLELHHLTPWGSAYGGLHDPV
jgi:hypothetical protein